MLLAPSYFALIALLLLSFLHASMSYPLLSVTYALPACPPFPHRSIAVFLSTTHLSHFLEAPGGSNWHCAEVAQNLECWPRTDLEPLHSVGKDLFPAKDEDATLCSALARTLDGLRPLPTHILLELAEQRKHGDTEAQRTICPVSDGEQERTSEEWAVNLAPMFVLATVMVVLACVFEVALFVLSRITLIRRRRQGPIRLCH